MTSRRRTWLFRLLTALIVLLGLEGGARLLEALSDTLPGPYHAHYDARAGIDPGTEVQSYDRIEIANAGGYRGPYRPPEREGDVFRIVLLGDSMSYGFGVAYEESWPYLLEQGLNRLTRRRVELLDFAVPGFNTMMELRNYREIASRYRPDHVLLGYFPNDAALGERHLPSVWRHCPLELPTAWKVAAIASEYSGLVRVIHDLVCLWRFDQPGVLTEHQMVIDPQFPGFRCSMYWLDELKRDLDAAGVGLTVVQIPFLDRRDLAAGDPEAEVQARLARLLEARGLRSVNLYPGTVARDVMSMRLPDTHPNAAGHWMFAEILLARPQALGLPAELFAE